MKKEIAKIEKFILMRNGIRIYLDEVESKVLSKVLEGNTESTFLEVKGRYINTADLSGIFLPEDYENLWHEKRGDWQCKSCGKWLSRNEKECISCKSKSLYPNLSQSINGQIPKV